MWPQKLVLMPVMAPLAPLLASGAQTAEGSKMSTETAGVLALAPGTGLPIPGAGTGSGSELVVEALEADTRGAYSLLDWRGMCWGRADVPDWGTYHHGTGRQLHPRAMRHAA